ncbi:MAG: response regulator [Bacteroidetes bacterium 4572_112]|nr:MAG: response regulator [Bacteroidetes bacterium 4572_112]
MDNNWQDKTILVVDDIEVNYILLKKQLQKTNAKTIWLKNGLESVDYVKENKEVDIILMDIRMPIMNGLEATKLIKIINPDIPIIIQTAYVVGEEFDNIEYSGCDDYFFKPILAKELYSKIAKQLQE